MGWDVTLVACVFCAEPQIAEEADMHGWAFKYGRHATLAMNQVCSGIAWRWPDGTCGDHRD